MKNDMNYNPTSSSGLSQSSAFTFAASAKAFKVIIDGIYSDKPRAVIRELSSNAFDAHIAAGKSDVPFQITLPSVIRPELIIRDFGPSMSHEDMLTKFTQAFLSSKDQSNEYVGSLGLGRLSAFAYTDGFSVNTYIDKLLRCYTVFINDGGIPELALMGEFPTEEADGFEVRFPIKMSDCTAFWEACKHTMIGFDIKPHFTNEGVEQYEVTSSGSGWKTYKGLYGCYAKQGCVIYPIDLSLVSHDTLLVNMNGLVVDFPIGQLDYSSSREALGYTDKTKANLQITFDNITKIMLAELQNQLDACKTWHQSAKLFSNMEISEIPRKLLNQLTYNKVQAVSHISVNNKSLKRHDVHICGTNVKPESKSFKVSFSEKQHYTPIGLPVFAVKIGTVAATPRIQLYVSTLPDFYRNSSNVIYTVFYEDRRGLERMKRVLGYPDIIDVASLPRPVQNRSASQVTKGLVKAKIMTNRGYFEAAEIDITQPSFYIRTEGTSPLDVYSSSLINAIEALAHKGNVTYSEPVGITCGQVARFKRRGWVDAWPLIKAKLFELYNNDEDRAILGFALHTSGTYKVACLPKNLILIKTTLGNDHLLTKIVEDSEAIEVASSNENCKFVLTAKNHASEAIEPLPNLQIETQRENIEVFLKRYSMFSLISSSFHNFFDREYADSVVKIVLDYIKNTVYEEDTINLQLAA